MTKDCFKSLLQTKIYKPQLREGHVSRPRLLSRLNQSEAGQNILITAPAGYGKTTLAVEWLSQLEAQQAWYSIDARDNDLERFLTYLIYTLDQVESGLGRQALDMICSVDPPPAERSLTYLVNDLTRLEGRTVLILDDYHLIENQEIHQAVSYLLEHHPPQLQFLILSREELPFPTSGLRAQNQLLEVDLFDLRFTVKEADAFLKNTFGIELPFEQVVKLDNQVEGWVTGLQLAALNLRSQENREQFLEHFSGQDRLVQGYLFEEVVADQPAPIQRFLYRTSPLDQFSAPLCDYILEIENSQEILESLKETNLFLIPLDNRGVRYRYHHLFSAALRDHLVQHEPGLVRETYSRASSWYETQGEIEQAVEYAIRAEDFYAAAELISRIANRVVREGGRRRIKRWLTAFPIEVLRQHLHLWVHLAMAHFIFGEFAMADRLLERLWGDEEHLRKFNAQQQNLIQGYQIGLLSSIALHTRMDVEQVLRLTGEFMEIFPDEVDFGRSIGPGYHAAACFHLGRIDRAQNYIERALELSKQDEYSRMKLLWSSTRTQIQLATGNLTQAEHYLNQAEEIDRRLGVQESSVVSSVIIGRGYLHYERNDFKAANALLEKGFSIAREVAFLDYLIWGLPFYQRLQISQGAYPQARDTGDEIARLAAQYEPSPLFYARLEALRIMIDLEEGKIERARIWAEENDGWEEQEELGPQEYKWLTLARFWLVDQQPDQALPLLLALSSQARVNQRGRSYLISSLLLSKAYLLLEDPFEAKSTLAEALAFAQPHGYIRTFIDEGHQVWELIQQIQLDQGQPYLRDYALSADYLTRLSTAFEEEVERCQQLGLDFGCLPQEELLTRREGEIIALLAQGLSYAEMARELSITENTIRTHIKNIYRKLQVNNRTEAVLQARALNLL